VVRARRQKSSRTWNSVREMGTERAVSCRAHSLVLKYALEKFVGRKRLTSEYGTVFGNGGRLGSTRLDQHGEGKGGRQNTKKGRGEYPKWFRSTNS